ncbi:jun dimerization protein 2 [Echinops telfairi]|uniref:Jun dimerization protein 2 n=1 Tax=Echinops telfairi TaxID=9371 RepID=A0ABM0IFD2_ECHTE|nr:jun dimerization protein 2 [Echinops telfairi]
MKWQAPCCFRNLGFLLETGMYLNSTSRLLKSQGYTADLHLSAAWLLIRGWTTAPAMMPGQIPDPSVTAGSLPGLGPLTGLPSAALTTEELKYADIRNIGAMIAPLHFLEVKLGKRPQPVKSELDEEEERRKRRREKNKVAAARCRNKKKERTEFLQRESERLELMNAELKTQIEELKQERQQLILMLNRHRPTCIVRTDSVKTPESEGNPLLEQLEKK